MKKPILLLLALIIGLTATNNHVFAMKQKTKESEKLEQLHAKIKSAYTEIQNFNGNLETFKKKIDDILKKFEEIKKIAPTITQKNYSPDNAESIIESIKNFYKKLCEASFSIENEFPSLRKKTEQEIRTEVKKELKEKLTKEIREQIKEEQEERQKSKKRCLQFTIKTIVLIGILFVTVITVLLCWNPAIIKSMKKAFTNCHTKKQCFATFNGCLKCLKKEFA